MQTESELMTKDSETPAALPGLLTHRIDKRPAFRGGRVAAAAGLGLMVALGLILLAASFPAAGWGILSIVIIVVLVGIVGVWIDRRIRVSIVLRSVVGRSDGDLREIVEEFVELGGLEDDCPPMAKLPAALVSVGLLGQTVYVGWDVALESIEPLTNAFEPRLLNEADEAFDELAEAATSEGSTFDGPDADSPTSYSDRLALRRIRRNVKIRGGWVPVAASAVLLISAGVESLERGSIIWYFPVMLFGFLFSLFGVATTGAFSKEQWLIVPGGLLLRKAANRGKKVSLHLFDRRQCAMCVQQQHAGRWNVSVADADASETTTITDRERRLLLRAWLSPVAPPPLEQLVDLS